MKKNPLIAAILIRNKIILPAGLHIDGPANSALLVTITLAVHWVSILSNAAAIVFEAAQTIKKNLNNKLHVIKCNKISFYCPVSIVGFRRHRMQQAAVVIVVGNIPIKLESEARTTAICCGNWWHSTDEMSSPHRSSADLPWWWCGGLRPRNCSAAQVDHHLNGIIFIDDRPLPCGSQPADGEKTICEGE